MFFEYITFYSMLSFSILTREDPIECRLPAIPLLLLPFLHLLPSAFHTLHAHFPSSSLPPSSLPFLSPFRSSSFLASYVRYFPACLLLSFLSSSFLCPFRSSSFASYVRYSRASSLLSFLSSFLASFVSFFLSFFLPFFLSLFLSIYLSFFLLL